LIIVGVIDGCFCGEILKDFFAVHLMSLTFFCYLTAAVKQTAATKESSKKALEDGLANWFGNARDRGEGCRKNNRRAENENQQTAGI
jgi:hypothetical protein